MVKVKREAIILEKTDLEFENQAVLNPGCIKVGNYVYMFYRAVKQGNFSSIGYCKLDGPLNVVERATRPILTPEHDYEAHGIEDPRIVYMDGKYYMFYMAYNGKNVVTAYATSKDLKKWEKKGQISCLIAFSEAKKLFGKSEGVKKYDCYDIYNKISSDTKETTFIWGKDSFIFPKKFKGKYALLHRVLPSAVIIYFKKFSDLTPEYWKENLKQIIKHEIISPKYDFESRHVGAGAPPIETEKGWLFIYHAVKAEKGKKIYQAAAALLDKKDPTKKLGRLKQPLFKPELEWELKGDVNNVVFPTGTALFGDKLYIYYGAADKRIAVASIDINELIDELIKEGP